MFQLTLDETKNIYSRFQFETLNIYGKMQGHNIKYLPYVFTEEGVAMLATVLRTEIAEIISIRIMDAFVAMRKYLSHNNYEKRLSNIETKILDYDHKFNEVFDKLEEKNLKNEIYFEGQIYQAYSKIVDILSEAKKEIVLIDSYADKTTLDIISKIQVQITLITKSKNNLKQIDVDKYKSEYSNLNIVYNDTFHDRYFILDNHIVYHCGASLNHAGSKTFSINKLEDELVIDLLINKVNQINIKLKTDD